MKEEQANHEKFLRFRAEHPVFSYDGYDIARENGDIVLSWRFAVEGLCEFRPVTRVKTDNLAIFNAVDGATARAIVFSLGLAEAVSYWKCACPPRFALRCGDLDADTALWWKRLWFGGLGEFFYRNGIETDFGGFVNFDNQSGFPAPQPGGETFAIAGVNLIPVGGGKDSAVTLELLRELREHNLCFTLNDQEARTQTAAAAGYGPERILKTYRAIDPELLKRNAEGYLNGHTPFSSVVAFLAYYCALITGAEYIVLSNESSASEANTADGDVNHQYSKSYGFEQAFREYARRFGPPIEYFSLLRGFSELQIAARFAGLPQYHAAFRSCNAGSKRNVWCRKCAKCLFVYIILSPFLEPEALAGIFGGDLFEDETLFGLLDRLAGLEGEKPFECVGTAAEAATALAMTVERRRAAGRPLPPLLRHFAESEAMKAPRVSLAAYDGENSIPDRFKKYAKEMLDYVAGLA
ncbi:MAG TPA: hypothetical protein PL044_02315 [Clostridiales bacterium]|nr:hypothetical protein [Clostridiales bacterium]HQH62756.1 hypothetical protein [Clostridiales bacterium]HQK72597.1 hypothetical protein [Clostridiales bacterium]